MNETFDEENFEKIFAIKNFLRFPVEWKNPLKKFHKILAIKIFSGFLLFSFKKVSLLNVPVVLAELVEHSA